MDKIRNLATEEFTFGFREEHAALERMKHALRGWDGIPEALLHAERFETVAHLCYVILMRAGAKPGDLPINEKAQDAMVNHVHWVLARITHTDAYLEFLDNAREITMERIGNDIAIEQALKNWDAPDCPRKATLTKFRKHYCKAAEEVSGVWVPTPQPYYFMQAPKFSKFFQKDLILGGYMQRGAVSSEDSTFFRNTVGINTHDRAPYHNPEKALGVDLHEGVHHLNAHFANLYECGEIDGLEELLFDAVAYSLRDAFQASVPSTIYSAYKRQCFEEIAFMQQSFLELEVAQKILGRDVSHYDLIID